MTERSVACSLVRAPAGETVPVSDGQVILRADTGEVEFDIGNRRVSAGGAGGTIGVDALPEVPQDRIYLYLGNFWAHDGTKWVRLGGCTVGTPDARPERVRITAAGGDFQMLHLAHDTEILPPRDLEEYGREIRVEVTDTHYYSFTLGQETFGGIGQVSAVDSNSWLVTFHRGWGNTVRWRVDPLRPNTNLQT